MALLKLDGLAHERNLALRALRAADTAASRAAASRAVASCAAASRTTALHGTGYGVGAGGSGSGGGGGEATYINNIRFVLDPFSAYSVFTATAVLGYGIKDMCSVLQGRGTEYGTGFKAFKYTPMKPCA